MAERSRIISLAPWLETSAGRYLLEWEQAHLDVAVADLFGFHALQLGLPQLDALRANRMPHRWIATESPDESGPVDAQADDAEPADRPPAERARAAAPAAHSIALRCDFDALPFDSQSLDLVVLPHALELARDPHLALREVERVLVPEGRVVVVGFNPASLWGLRQRLGHVRRGLGIARNRPLFLPSAGEFIGYRRLRDWLRLLSFEVEAGRFGCFRPPVATQAWLDRYQWSEQAGERWWPVFGAAYFVVAVKRVRGMRLIGLVRQQRQKAATTPVVAINQTRERERETA